MKWFLKHRFVKSNIVDVLVDKKGVAKAKENRDKSGEVTEDELVDRLIYLIDLTINNSFQTAQTLEAEIARQIHQKSSVVRARWCARGA